MLPAIGGARGALFAAADEAPLHASGRCEDDAWFASLRDEDEAPPPDAFRKRTAAKPASTEIPRNATGWRFAKSVALSTRSRTLPLRIFSAASSTYCAAEVMPRAVKVRRSRTRGTPRGCCRQASRSNPHPIAASRAPVPEFLRRAGGHVLGGVGHVFELVPCNISRRAHRVAGALIYLSAGSATLSFRF